MDRLSNKLEMEDENTIELMVKSEEIVHNIEWDRKYGEKLNNMRDKEVKTNTIFQSSSNTKERE